MKLAICKLSQHKEKLKIKQSLQPHTLHGDTVVLLLYIAEFRMRKVTCKTPH